MSESPRPSEDDLIARWFRPLATDPGAFRLGDDCASLTPPDGMDLVLKTDAVASGIHFFADDPWDAVARKALRVNLSDLAAKGARPLGYLLSIALPSDWRADQLEAFARGLGADQATFGVALWGGDTIRSPAGLVVSITVIGAVPRGAMVRRGAAAVGDVVFVSGTIGDAGLGLKLRHAPDLARTWGLDVAGVAHLLGRYLVPQPRVALAPAVLAHASAAMDVSDGLGIDLGRMIRVSGVGAEIRGADIPLSAAARAAIAVDRALFAEAVTAGDDYEILATVPPARAGAFAAAAAAAGCPVTAIGTISAPGSAPVILDPTGRPLDLRTSGFRHF